MRACRLPGTRARMEIDMKRLHGALVLVLAAAAGSGWMAWEGDAGERVPGGPGYTGGRAASGLVIPLDLRGLAAGAELVVRGRVLGNHCTWDRSRRMIWTDTRLRVEACWKGEAGEEVVVREPGGRVGDVEVRAPQAVRYREDRSYLVFLARDALGRLRTLGNIQGRMPVVDGDHGRPCVDLTRVPRRVLRGSLPGTADPGLRELALERLRPLVEVHAPGEGR